MATSSILQSSLLWKMSFEWHVQNQVLPRKYARSHQTSIVQCSLCHPLSSLLTIVTSKKQNLSTTLIFQLFVTMPLHQNTLDKVSVLCIRPHFGRPGWLSNFKHNRSYHNSHVPSFLCTQKAICDVVTASLEHFPLQSKPQTGRKLTQNMFFRFELDYIS